MKKLEQEFLQQIEKYKLLSASDKVLVAISGGADSVALLYLLKATGVTCAAAHCNFHLRGEESLRDEKFVRDLCEQLNITLHVIDFETEEYARQRHISIEMAARDLRYKYFHQLLNKHGYTKIAVAHHLNDNAETLLLNLLRGTGLRGLTGMKHVNNNIIRPLLNFSKQDITTYLAEIGQDYVTDSSNLEADVVRNRIRIQLMPMMREINPIVDQSIHQTAIHLSEIEEYYQQAIQKDIDEISKKEKGFLLKVDIPLLMQKTSPHLLLFEMLYPMGFNPSQIDSVYHSLQHTGAKFESGNIQLLIDRNQILLQEKNIKEEDEVIFIPSAETELGNCCIKATIINAKELTEIPKTPEKVALDAEKILTPLTLRYTREGDKFQPFGMKGKKLVSDYMTDHKMSLFQKEQQCVVCSGDDIIWLVGQRPDHRYAIIPGKTQTILLLEQM